MDGIDEGVRKSMAGVRITGFTVDDDRLGAWLDGERDGQPVRYRFDVEGDCCSDTWIESVIEESALIGHTILSVEDISLPDGTSANGNDRTTHGFYEDEMTFYALAITTDRGKCVIDYRNSSNGYYGGSMIITEKWR